MSHSIEGPKIVPALQKFYKLLPSQRLDVAVLALEKS